MESEKMKIDISQILIGCVLIGASIYEFSTFYFTSEYLIPYQQTNFLRGLFSNGLLPIAIGLGGLRQIRIGFRGKPVSNKSNIPSYNPKYNRYTNKYKPGILSYTVQTIIVLSFAICILYIALAGLALFVHETTEVHQFIALAVLICSIMAGLAIGVTIVKKLQNTRFFRWLNNKW